jgi:hypothetical protein
MVDWVIVNSADKQDLVGRAIDVHSQAFLTKFTLVAQQSDGILLFHRQGQPLLPLHPGMTIWNVPHDKCE